jgi:hypothetical protein
MIKKQSDDPDVQAAAAKALGIIEEILANLPKAETYDYGGHVLRVGEYDVCTRCTEPIAEAQQAANRLDARLADEPDETVREHLEIAVELLRLEATAAVVRAELHNGHGSEKILNHLLGFMYDRKIHDEYDHNHGGNNNG